MNKNDVSINIKNLLYKVLLSWRLILICAIIFAILGNCYGVYKSWKDSKNSGGTTADSKIEAARRKADEAEAGISAEKRLAVENAANMYSLYDKALDTLLDYHAHSVIMQVDYDRVPCVELRYFVDDHFKVEYPEIQKHEYAGDIAKSYASLLLDADTVSAIAAATGLEEGYVREVVSAYADGNYLCVDIVGFDAQQCDAISGICKDRVKNLKSVVSGDLPKHDISLISDGFQVKRNDGIYEKQSKKISDINSIRENMVGIELDMTEEELYCYGLELEYLSLIKAKEQGLLLDEPAKNTGISFVNKKLLVLGFAGGAALAILLVILVYVLNPVIRVQENLSVYFEQSVLGTVWLGNSRKKFLGVIDRLITKWFYGREGEFEFTKRLDMLATGIEISMAKEGFAKVYLTGASEKADGIIKEIKERLKDKCTVESGECIIYNPGSLKECSGADAVVFVEAAGDSRFEEVAKELELAKQSKVKVMGFVLVQ